MEQVRDEGEEFKKNKLLPYGKSLDEEAFQHLKEIKTHLGSCVLLREPREPLLYWLSRLTWYIELYGLKFSKEDYMLLIQLLYELMTVPDMPLYTISQLYGPLRKLLRKKKFVTPGEDFTLPWKPLYDLCRKVFWSGYLKQAVLNITSDVKMDLEDLVLKTRYYFPPSATQEILDELRPLLCPSDAKSMKFGVQMLSWFLPLTSAPEVAGTTYKLWFDEMLRLWDACSNNAANWEDHMMYLMGWLAVLNIGEIDWEEYIPTLYSRFLTIFKLPVYYKKAGSLKPTKIFEDRVASWIVSSLGGGSKSQDYLDQLLKTLESYCHSANNGYWTCIIKSFLKKISKCFILRVKRERFKKPFWRIRTPEHKKLSDEDIEHFVNSMHSISMLAMFTPAMFADIAPVFQELATLRPDIVVPPLLERFYSTINCVTEPHKLTAVLKCVRSVARPMLTGGLNSSFSGGKTHVIPLLFAVLPGIDPNDHQKLILSLQFISTFLNMIPIVDCSSCSQLSDLTAEEEEVASATSQFEEFILQYMERIFLFIESVAQENVRIENNASNLRSKLERHVLILMQGSCMTVCGQMSPPIFMVALKKMYNYSMAKIFEREVAGRAVAVMIKAFARVNGEETYKLFIPKLSAFILEAARSQDIKNEERLDSELLYKMLLLSQVVAGTPHALVPYVPILLEVVDETLHLKCKEGYEFSTFLLSHILLMFSSTYPINYYTSPTTYDQNSKTFPVRDWGKGLTFNELDIEWYSPTETEISLVEKIFWKYLMPELEKIEKYTNGEVDYSRDDIRCTLTIVVSLFSCGNLLAQWQDEPLLAVCESQVPFELVKLNLGIQRFISMPDGSNVFKLLIDKMDRFQRKLMKETDDTVSFMLLTKIWSHLLYYDVALEMKFYERKEFLKIWKNNYANRVGMTESNVRSVLVEAVALKHIQRILADGVLMTKTHKTVLLNLFDLATCDYKPVQCTAGNIIHGIIVINADNSFLVDEIVKNLRVDTSKCSEKFKSTLALLKSRHHKWFAFSESYDCLKKILPALVTSMPSEEPPVIKLLEELTNCTVYSQWHYAINLQIPENVLDIAKRLWTQSAFELLHPLPTDSEIQRSLVRLETDNRKVQNDYEDLIRSLLNAIQNGGLQWRYETMAATFLAAVLLAEEQCPLEVVQYYLRILTHELVAYRKIAIKPIVCILKLYKAKTLKVLVDPYSLSPSKPVSATSDLYPGVRPDNTWCCYKPENTPMNEAEWNEVRFSYRCYLGYYTWPKQLYLCSSPSAQPMNNFSVDRLSDIGKEIDSFFTNPSNVDKLIEYFSLEEIKGESLRIYHCDLFKYLFKIHGDRYFDIFRPHFEKLVEKEEDSHQRCAAEMIAGMLRGTKSWPFDQAQKMIQWCVPLLRKTLDKMTVETQKHWGSAIATALFRCDVNKSSYLFELLMEEPIKEDAAFKDCGRLYVLQSGVVQSWRLPEMYCKLLEYIKPHLANRYQNLRERLGSVLVTIFEADIEAKDWNRTPAPHVSDFVSYLLPKLDILYTIAPNSNGAQNDDNTKALINGKEATPDDAEVEEAILLLKTVCKWCLNAAQRCVYPLKPDFFKILPLLCFMENYDKDDELKRCCKHTLSVLSFSVVLRRDIPVFLDAIERVSVSNSWCAKCTGLDFLQVFAFHNLFLISSRDEWMLKIMKIVLELLVDGRCEVRQKAGEVISGFIHHNLIKDIGALVEKFKEFSRVSLNKSNLNVRHAGVIGLCAFINAYPYTVPLEVPPLFEVIGNHLKDPEPIPSTIRKTLGNFKRTHYADWEQSKLQFTPDQLDVFSDIMIPPNHYA